VAKAVGQFDRESKGEEDRKEASLPLGYQALANWPTGQLTDRRLVPSRHDSNAPFPCFPERSGPRSIRSGLHLLREVLQNATTSPPNAAPTLSDSSFLTGCLLYYYL
jgi:hypothetical protein